MDYKLKYITNSKRGLYREKNQDRIFILERETFYFFALFDGVSSYSNSYALIEKFKRKLQSRIDGIDFEGNNIDYLLFDTNREISCLDIKGASTISGLFISKENDIVKYVNVGDSRVYIFNSQFLEQVTIDDSISIGSNIITKYIGSSDLSLDDFKLHKLEKDYNYLLCTDGFYSLMGNNLKEYFIALNFKYLQNTRKRISYLQRGENKDNSSYILIKNEVPIRN